MRKAEEFIFTWITFNVCLSVTLQRHQGSDCNPNTRLIRQILGSYQSQLSPDGEQIAGLTGQPNPLRILGIWDTTSGALLNQVNLGDDPPSLWRFSPSGDRLFIATQQKKRVMILRIRDFHVLVEQYLNDQSITGAAWSPDGSLVAVSGLDIHMLPYTEMLNASTATPANDWRGNFHRICWWPSEFLTTVRFDSGKFTVSRFHSDGSMVSTSVIAGDHTSWIGSIACAPNSDVAIGDHDKMVVVRRDGRWVEGPGANAPVWSHNGRVIAACDPSSECTLYDSSLLPLLTLAETRTHQIAGLSPDGRMLYSANIQGSFAWNVETQQKDIFTPAANATISSLFTWVDRDRLLVRGDNVELMEFNVRTHQSIVVPSQILPPPIIFSCVMNGSLYQVAQYGGVVVSSHGIFVRRFVVVGVTNGVWSCSPTGQYIAAVSGNRLMVWTSVGTAVPTAFPSFPSGITVLAFYNTSRFAVTTFDGHGNTELHLWSSITLSLVKASISNDDWRCHKWSNDGSWLIILSTRQWGVITCEGEMIVNGYEVFQALGWSEDGHWMLGSGSELMVANPSLKLKSTFIVPAEVKEIQWNPFTLEFLFTTPHQNEVRVWNPVPVIFRSVGGNSGGIVNITTSLFGANLLPSTVKTMLRWIDSSTSIPQCLFLNGTRTDGHTLSTSDIILPDPGMYTVYIQAPTGEPVSPWSHSDFISFTAVCSGFALPALNLTGGLTTCVCPTDRYAVHHLEISFLDCPNCPPNGRCDGSSQVVSEEGFWPVSEFQFLPCAKGACIGENRCAKWHQGPVCGLCEKGSGQHGYGRCRPCNAVGVDVVLCLLGIFCWIIFCTIQSAFALGWRKRARKTNNSVQLAAIIVSTTQTNALLMDVNVKMDVLSGTLGYSEELTQAASIQSPLLSCVLINFGVLPGHIHYLKQVVMLVLPLIVGCCLLAVRAISRRRGRPLSWDIRVPILVVWASLQSSVTTSLYQTLECREINWQGVGWRMSHDISVPCYDETYWWFVVLVTIPAMIVMVLLSFTIFWLLQFRPQAAKSGYLWFLVKSYRRNWWYLVIFYRKVLLTAVVTFTKNPFYVGCCLILACLIQILVWPSASFVVNIAELSSLMISAFIFSTAGALGLSDPAFGTYKLGAVALLLAGITSYVLQISLLIHDRCRGVTKTDHGSSDDMQDEEPEDTENSKSMKPISREDNYSYLLDQDFAQSRSNFFLGSNFHAPRSKSTNFLLPTSTTHSTFYRGKLTDPISEN